MDGWKNDFSASLSLQPLFLALLHFHSTRLLLVSSFCVCLCVARILIIQQSFLALNSDRSEGDELSKEEEFFSVKEIDDEDDCDDDDDWGE